MDSMRLVIFDDQYTDAQNCTQIHIDLTQWFYKNSMGLNAKKANWMSRMLLWSIYGLVLCAFILTHSSESIGFEMGNDYKRAQDLYLTDSQTIHFTELISP